MSEVRSPAVATRDLIVALHDGSPRQVRLETADGTAAAAEFHLSPDLSVRTQALRRAMVRRSVQRLIRDVRASAPDDASPVSDVRLGEELFRAVFNDPRLQRIYAVWRSGTGRLRLRIRLPITLAWVPWELLRDPHDGAWLALTNNLLLMREVDSTSTVSPSRVSRSGLEILGVGANPIDLPQLDIAHERNVLARAMQGSGRVTWVSGDATAVALLDDRRRHDHVFHFAGHGSYDASGGAVYWGDDLAQRLDSDKLATLLARHPTIRLVVLNACHGATSEEAAESPSIANALVQRGVPAVLAMQAPILDDVALQAAQSFYGALARGAAIDDAVSALRRALHHKDLDWASLVLTVTSANHALFQRSASSRRWLLGGGLGVTAAAAVIATIARSPSTPPSIHSPVSGSQLDAGSRVEPPEIVPSPSAAHPVSPPAAHPVSSAPVSPVQSPPRPSKMRDRVPAAVASSVSESAPVTAAEFEWAQWKMPNPAGSTTNPASYSLTSGIVRDKVTGLDWQQLSNSQEMTLAEAHKYCTGLSLAGKGWRLPTFIELYSLVDFDAPAPAIDSQFQRVTTEGESVFWTSTPEVGDPEKRRWVVQFSHGDPSVRRPEGHGFVRCVRSTSNRKSAGQALFTRNDDGTISDTRTQLRWQQATSENKYARKAATEHCADLGTGWRLPSVKELMTLVDHRRRDPAADPMFSIPPEMVWTSSGVGGSQRNGWTINFALGGAPYDPVEQPHLALCVR